MIKPKLSSKASITATGGASVLPTDLKVVFNSLISPVGKIVCQGTQGVSDTSTELSLPTDIGYGCYYLLQNVDSVGANPIYMDPVVSDPDTPSFKIEYGEFMFFKGYDPNNYPYVKTDAGQSSKVDYFVIKAG